MKRDGREHDDARKLVVRYLEQMKELGETEVYLPSDARDRILGDTVAPAPGHGRSGSGASARPREVTRVNGAGGGVEARAESRAEARPAAEPRPLDAGSSRSSFRPGSAAEKAAALPEPEVVAVELAIGGGPTTVDMFSERSGLEGCSSLTDLEKLASACDKCELSGGRTNVVFGVGNPSAALMFVGEAPGRDEDLKGIPFVGRAGQLLNKILAAVEIERDDVYIGNIIKCRPPNNRTPLTSEIDACMPYLAKQISCIRPRVICTLGLPATQTLLGLRGSMGSLRGKIYVAGEIAVVPTYHPAAALRDPRYKKPIWEDFLIVRREYDGAGRRV
jgi:uracil-DNA glycosylase family 4